MKLKRRVTPSGGRQVGQWNKLLWSSPVIKTDTFWNYFFYCFPTEKFCVEYLDIFVNCPEYLIIPGIWWNYFCAAYCISLILCRITWFSEQHDFIHDKCDKTRDKTWKYSATDCRKEKNLKSGYKGWVVINSKGFFLFLTLSLVFEKLSSFSSHYREM